MLHAVRFETEGNLFIPKDIDDQGFCYPILENECIEQTNGHAIARLRSFRSNPWLRHCEVAQLPKQSISGRLLRRCATRNDGKERGLAMTTRAAKKDL